MSNYKIQFPKCKLQKAVGKKTQSRQQEEGKLKMKRSTKKRKYKKLNNAQTSEALGAQGAKQDG